MLLDSVVHGSLPELLLSASILTPHFSLLRYRLTEVIDSTLDLLVQEGGPPALKAIKHVIPTYTYFDPKD